MRIFVASLALVLMIATQSAAQFPVFDAANFSANTATSIQSAVTAIQTVLLVADSVTNLLGIGSVSSSNDIQSDQQALVAIINDAEGLAWDIQSLEIQLTMLLGLDGAPDSTWEFRRRMWELRRIRSEQYMKAMRIQMLMQTAVRIADRIVRIINNFAKVLGNLSGQQIANDELGQLVHIANNQQIMNAAFQRAEAERQAEEPLIIESIERINQNLMVDWPR